MKSVRENEANRFCFMLTMWPPGKVKWEWNKTVEVWQLWKKLVEQFACNVQVFAIEDSQPARLITLIHMILTWIKKAVEVSGVYAHGRYECKCLEIQPKVNTFSVQNTKEAQAGQTLLTVYHAYLSHNPKTGPQRTMRTTPWIQPHKESWDGCGTAPQPPCPDGWPGVDPPSAPPQADRQWGGRSTGWVLTWGWGQVRCWAVAGPGVWTSSPTLDVWLALPWLDAWCSPPSQSPSPCPLRPWWSEHHPLSPHSVCPGCFDLTA